MRGAIATTTHPFNDDVVALVDTLVRVVINTDWHRFSFQLSPRKKLMTLKAPIIATSWD